MSPVSPAQITVLLLLVSVPWYHLHTHNLLLNLLNRCYHEHPLDVTAGECQPMFSVLVMQGCVIVGTAAAAAAPHLHEGTLLTVTPPQLFESSGKTSHRFDIFNSFRVQKGRIGCVSN